MSNVSVSVIVPVYNGEKYLRECIESVLVQECESWQLIIVDDGSTDLTAQICTEYAEKDTRITYIRQENQGVSVARNNGIKHSAGEWITFLDADDVLYKKALSLPFKYGAGNDMILGGCSENLSDFKLEDRCVEIPSFDMQLCILDIVNFKKKYKQTSMINDYNHWSVWGRFFKRSIICDNDLKFSKDIRLGEDLLFCMNYYNCIKKVLLNYSFIYYYRPNETSVSRNFRKDRLTNTKLLIKEIDKSLNKKELNRPFCSFVVNRIAKCCFDYYADIRCDLSNDEIAKSLKEFCEEPLCSYAISKASCCGLAYGKKDSILYGLLLLFLKKKEFKYAVKFLKKVN